MPTTSGTLTAERFDEFFRAVHGYKPFPWQSRLVRHLFETNGVWPAQLDLPTGTGKSTAAEIAIYCFAAGLDVPRRILFVVDRRTIVEQVTSVARHVRETLEGAEHTGAPGILGDVNAALRARRGDIDVDASPPFHVAELRGAVQEDREWTGRPDLPAIIATTVDQIGSRLLFRGYGISRGMLPVHAGLVGNDALFLLDEVQLARPFAALLAQIVRKRHQLVTDLPDRWQVVELSATPDASDADGFTLDAQDADDPVLGPRLTASKPATMRIVNRISADPIKAVGRIADGHCTEVQSLLDDNRVKTIGVVVNRVALATTIHARLADIVDAHDDLDVFLLTGRMRTRERDDVLELVRQRVESRVTTVDASSARRTIVVATQTIEAGADFDFDVLITDCAPLDSLVQRFGRVDRLGQNAQRWGSDLPKSVIIIGDRAIKERDDPIYGSALAETWSWLTETFGTEIDFGSSAMRAARIKIADETLLRPTPAGQPKLLDSHIERLVRTSPIPDADVSADTFLHGLGHVPNQDVEVLWRANVGPALDQLTAQNPPPMRAVEEHLSQLLTAVPPSPHEVVSVPQSGLRRWLADRGHPDPQTTDLESANGDVSTPTRVPPFVRWRDGTAEVVTSLNRLAAGDTIVLPTSYGGLHAGTWSPGSTDEVSDIAEDLADGRSARLRLEPSTLDPRLLDTSTAQGGRTDPALMRATTDGRGAMIVVGSIPSPNMIAAQGFQTTGREAKSDVLDWIGEVQTRIHNRYPDSAAGGTSNAEWRRTLERIDALASTPPEHIRLQLVSGVGRLSDTYVVSTAPDTPDANSDRRASSNLGTTYPLDAHLGDTERWAEAVTSDLGLSSVVRSTVIRAAKLHDIGKADSRFQAYLSEGRLTDGLLAKSAIPRDDRARDHAARVAAGWPPGLRHEVASWAMLSDYYDDPIDGVLLRCLVATHHGYGRPFFPAQLDAVDTAITHFVDNHLFSTDQPYSHATPGGQATQDFFTAVERYGPYGLAWLEAMLRLADHCASAEAARAPRKVDQI